MDNLVSPIFVSYVAVAAAALLGITSIHFMPRFHWLRPWVAAVAVVLSLVCLLGPPSKILGRTDNIDWWVVFSLIGMVWGITALLQSIFSRKTGT